MDINMLNKCSRVDRWSIMCEKCAIIHFARKNGKANYYLIAQRLQNRKELKWLWFVLCPKEIPGECSGTGMISLHQSRAFLVIFDQRGDFLLITKTSVFQVIPNAALQSFALHLRNPAMLTLYPGRHGIWWNSNGAS